MSNPAYTAALCDAARSRLVVIDVQERLAGAMDEAVREQVLRNTGTLVQAANLLELPVLRTEQYPQGLGPTARELEVHLPDSAAPLEKTCFSACAAPGFRERLSDTSRQQTVLVGMETHVCVLQTALELHALGQQVFVVDDAVCSRRKANHKSALRRLTQAGIVVSTTESTLFEWLHDADHEHFKALSRLIK